MASSVAENSQSSQSVPYVQELVKKSPLTSVPECYIRSENKETPFTETQTFCPPPILPTIDMQQLVSGQATELELENLHSACRDWGFFQVFACVFYTLHITKFVKKKKSTCRSIILYKLCIIAYIISLRYSLFCFFIFSFFLFFFFLAKSIIYAVGEPWSQPNTAREA